MSDAFPLRHFFFNLRYRLINLFLLFIFLSNNWWWRILILTLSWLLSNLLFFLAITLLLPKWRLFIDGLPIASILRDLWTWIWVNIPDLNLLRRRLRTLLFCFHSGLSLFECLPLLKFLLLFLPLQELLVLLIHNWLLLPHYGLGVNNFLSLIRLLLRIINIDMLLRSFDVLIIIIHRFLSWNRFLYSLILNHLW